MLRFSMLALLLVGCGSTVVDAPANPDGGDTGTLADSGTVVVDTGSPVDADAASPVDADASSPETGPGPGTAGAAPPPRPTAMGSGGVTKWFAVRKLQLGLTHRVTGVADANAWKQYGYDLDSRTTTKEDSKTSNNSCKRRAGSASWVLTDGELGRDNNFGQNFMSVVKSLKADTEDAANAVISSGESTLLLRLDNVGAADNASVPGALFIAGAHAGPPKWAGTDKWPIDTSSVDATKQPLFKFPGGYMAGGAWVSGEPGVGTALIPVILIRTMMRVPLDAAVISFDVATGGSGTIAGASNTAKFIAAMEPAMRSVGICPGNATFEQVAATVTQSADLVGGAPKLQDVTRECDAMSVAIGFTAAPIAPSDSYSMPVPTPDECVK